MRFWDASAIVPLLIHEPRSSRAFQLFKSKEDILIWTLTPVECYSALYRKDRENRVPMTQILAFQQKMRMLSDRWVEISHVERVRSVAQKLLASHPLRAADSLQLAAALVSFGQAPGEFVSFDERLNEAAIREGLVVVN